MPNAPVPDAPRCDMPGCGRVAKTFTDGAEKDDAYTFDPPAAGEDFPRKRMLGRKAVAGLNLCHLHLSFAFTADAAALAATPAMQATIADRLQGKGK